MKRYRGVSLREVAGGIEGIAAHRPRGVMTSGCKPRDLAAFARPAVLSALLWVGCGDDGPSQIPYGWGAAGLGGMHAHASGGSGGEAGVSGAGATGSGGSGGLAGDSGAGGGSAASGTGGDAGGSGEGAGGAGAEGGGGGDMNGGAGAGAMTAGTGGEAEPDETTDVGSGDIGDPVEGPAPASAADIGGEPFVLVKNWDFGTSGAVRDQAALIAEFQFADQFGTIASGTGYGAVMVAPSEELAVTAPDLGLPGDKQPVDDDPDRPYRALTADSLKTYVRPLSDDQGMVSASAHNAGNGSLVAKWKLPNGGALLERDLIWETRIRMPKPAAGYWLGLWASGNEWSSGPELNVLQAFSGAGSPANAFRSAAVGGQNSVDYGAWPDSLQLDPLGSGDLTEWHVWSWLYKRDDTFEVRVDGEVVQSGTIRWTLGGAEGANALQVCFMFVLSWGHTQISAVNIERPASDFPIEYEIDYSRVYLR